MVDSSLYLLFVLAISIHNTEEALWLPAWSNQKNKFHKPTDTEEFRFAVLAVTILALLATAFYLVFPDSKITSTLYFGFVGAMMVNVVFPHLVATIAMKKYAPGVVSGLFVLLPVNGLILYKAISAGVLSLFEVLVSTLITGALLLACLPLFFWLGRKIHPARPQP